jgi:hypothetical protein
VDRRIFLSGLGAALAGGASHRLAAQCVLVAPGVAGCTVGLSNHFHIVTQDCPERCWAASISGIFGYLGHPVNQDKIALAVFGPMFGTLPCLSSGNTKVLDAVLSHEWTDDNGVKFNASITGLFDPLNGVAAMDNDDLVSELQNDKPMLYCNRGHAMVIVGIDYRKDMAGNLIAVDRVRVADPYPGQGYHLLSPAEMVPIAFGGALTYVASVDVDGD